MERTAFHFSAAGLDIEAEIARGEFEGWIESDVMAVGRTIDLALDRAGLEVNEVHAVFMTGGTSYVPAVRRLFEERFGSERLRYGDAFNSVASGLALIWRRHGASTAADRPFVTEIDRARDS